MAMVNGLFPGESLEHIHHLKSRVSDVVIKNGRRLFISALGFGSDGLFYRVSDSNGRETTHYDEFVDRVVFEPDPTTKAPSP